MQLNACSRKNGGSGDVVGAWNEEVQLSGGRVLVVERSDDIKVVTSMGEQVCARVKAARINVIKPADLVGIPECPALGQILRRWRRYSAFQPPPSAR